MAKRARVPGIRRGPRAECKEHGSLYMLSMGRGARICALCHPTVSLIFNNRRERRSVLR